MKFKKHFLALLLSIAALISSAFALASCSGTTNNAGKVDEGASVGLEYTLSNDGTYYMVSASRSLYTDTTNTDIVISSTYNGLANLQRRTTATKVSVAVVRLLNRDFD